MANPGDFYGALVRGFEVKDSLVTEELKQSLPLIALSCRDGFVFATLNPFSSAKKIKPVYDESGIIMGGIGSLAALDSIHASLVNLVHYQELLYGRKDLNFTHITTEIRQAIEGNFNQIQLLPTNIYLVLGKALPTPHFYAIDWRGRLLEPEMFAVLGTSDSAGKLREELSVRYNQDLTVDQAAGLLKSLLADIPEYSPECFLELGMARISKGFAVLEFKKERGD